MRNAALTLGVIAGAIGLIVGFFSYGYTVAVEQIDVVGALAQQVEHVALVRTVALTAPILAIAGGAMARTSNLLGGILMLASAGGMLWALGFGVFTMFPIVMSGLGGVLALLARQPDAA